MWESTAGTFARKRELSSKKKAGIEVSDPDTRLARIR
jgi:hypothetical protein